MNISPRNTPSRLATYCARQEPSNSFLATDGRFHNRFRYLALRYTAGLLQLGTQNKWQACAKRNFCYSSRGQWNTSRILCSDSVLV